MTKNSGPKLAHIGVDGLTMQELQQLRWGSLIGPINLIHLYFEVILNKKLTRDQVYAAIEWVNGDRP